MFFILSYFLHFMSEYIILGLMFKRMWEPWISVSASDPSSHHQTQCNHINYFMTLYGVKEAVQACECFVDSLG